MFNKLLKYDFRHYLKLWLIGAGTALFMSCAGGFCARRISWLFEHDHTYLGMVFGLIIFVSVLCIAAFSVLTKLLLCMRYARSCYSDEGYLTFTLPVSRRAVFDSKIVTGVIYDFMTFVGTVLCGLLFGAFSMKHFFTMLFYNLHRFFEELGYAFGGMTAPFIIVIILIIILFSFLMLNVIFFCVSFAGIKVRKNKIIAGIGVGYLIHVILGFIIQFGAIITMFIFTARPHAIDSPAAITAALAILAVWLVGANAAVYHAQLNMLENKLNLA